jgi:tyrosyl-tRNA synthetase
MDIESKMHLAQQVGEEIITEEELRQLFETKQHPIAYDGFEPSGLAPIHFALLRAINVKDMLQTGIKFKFWVADWFAWINNKMNGDLELIHKVGEYFIEVWKVAGVPVEKVDFLWASENMDQEYWKRVVLIAKNTTIARMNRCLTIMGRKEGELQEASQYFYPAMQVSDIFQLECDICQLGMDQRRANMLAREVGPKLGLWKPVAIHHHMLMGLQGMKTPEGYETDEALDIAISSKMSKSRPESGIFVHDNPKEITSKIKDAFCPPKVVDNNPVLEFAKYIIFKMQDTLEITRPKKFGGDLEILSYEELENIYRNGNLHPLDLKNAVSKALDTHIAPIREHFEKNKHAKELYEFVKSAEISR